MALLERFPFALRVVQKSLDTVAITDAAPVETLPATAVLGPARAS